MDLVLITRASLRRVTTRPMAACDNLFARDNGVRRYHFPSNLFRSCVHVGFVEGRLCVIVMTVPNHGQESFPFQIGSFFFLFLAYQQKP